MRSIYTRFVSDADPFKRYSVALVMIVDPRFPAIVSTGGHVGIDHCGGAIRSIVRDGQPFLKFRLTVSTRPERNG
jgi:hypothetical protein